MQTTFPMLHELLQYELYASERYRRYVSVIMVRSPVDHQGLKEVFGSHVRQSDATASFDHTIAILMSETDQSDALSAVDRFNSALGSQFDARFAVATYPSDESSADALIGTAQRRLQKASNGYKGYVVYQD